jgi:hypothetical protein
LIVHAIGDGAKLVVHEGDRPPRLRLWKASPYGSVSPPIDLNGSGVG